MRCVACVSDCIPPCCCCCCFFTKRCELNPTQSLGQIHKVALFLIHFLKTHTHTHTMMNFMILKIEREKHLIIRALIMSQMKLYIYYWAWYAICKYIDIWNTVRHELLFLAWTLLGFHIILDLDYDFPIITP